MKKKSLNLLIGLPLFIIGIVLAVLFIRSDGQMSPLLLVLGTCLAGVGVYFLGKAWELFLIDKNQLSHETEPFDIVQATDVSISPNTLDKNNEMLSDWQKTAQARDKLKMLEAAAAAEEGK